MIDVYEKEKELLLNQIQSLTSLAETQKVQTKKEIAMFEIDQGFLAKQTKFDIFWIYDDILQEPKI